MGEANAKGKGKEFNFSLLYQPIANNRDLIGPSLQSFSHAFSAATGRWVSSASGILSRPQPISPSALTPHLGDSA